MDSEARWVNETGAASSGGTVLYSIEFELSDPFESATLEFEYAVDNLLGYSRSGDTPGVYINGMGLPGSIGGDHAVSARWTWPNAGGLLRVGTNHIQIYSRDTGLAAGIIFAGRITTASGSSYLSVDLEGLPVLRSGETAQFNLLLHNLTNETIPLAYICITLEGDALSVSADRTPDAVPWSYTGPPDPSFVAYDDTHAYIHFFVANLPPGERAGEFGYTVASGYQIVEAGAAIPVTVSALAIRAQQSKFGKAGYLLDQSDFSCLVGFMQRQAGLSLSDLSPALPCFLGLGSAMGASLAQIQGMPLAYFTSRQLVHDVVHEVLVPCGITAAYASSLIASPLILGTVAALGTACLIAEFGHCDDSQFECVEYLNGLVSSIDPNQLLVRGSGVGARFTQAGDELTYQLHFENSPEATAPAKTVQARLEIDCLNLDCGSIRIEAIGFGDEFLALGGVDVGTVVDIDLRPEDDMIVRFRSALLSNGNGFELELQALDPETMNLVPGALSGFLPPNQQPPEGDGVISFHVEVNRATPTNTLIAARAAIVFDSNPPLETNDCELLVDNEPPTVTAEIVSAEPDSGVVWYRLDAMDDASGVAGIVLLLERDGEEPIVSKVNGGSGSYRFQVPDSAEYVLSAVCADSAGNRSSATRLDPIGFPELWRRVRLDVRPNPGRGNTYFVLTGLREKEAQLKIYDLRGHLVESLSREQIQMDSQAIHWSGRDHAGRRLPSGIYLAEAQISDGTVLRKKFLVLK